MKLVKQREVLDSLRQVHAQHHPRMPDAVQDQFLAEHQDVVQHHPADYDDNHPDVELADKRNDFAAEVGLLYTIEVDFAGDELRVGSRMALPARLRQVGVVDRGTRVARREDVVHSVATGAIRDSRRADLGRHAVIACEVRRNTVPGNPKLRRELHAGMTCGTRSAHIAGGHRRVWIVRCLDGVDSVAVGADRRLPIAFRQRRTVNALNVLALDVGVALAAGRWHIGLGDRRLRVGPGQNVMGAVAVSTHGSRL